MKELESYLSKIQDAIKIHDRYKFEAYSFVMSALHKTVEDLKKPRHISGQELLEGIRKYAMDQFGPMTRTVLNYWGVERTEDFGHIVFALIDVGLLRKQPEDSLEDFKDVYCFEEAFDKGYKIEG